jgi:N-acetylmuramoyl-L-alanine amidase-like protein/putative peptidoglycan binding protein
MLLKPSLSEWRELKLGMAGHDVVAWQSVLRRDPAPPGWTSRWPIAVDGQFGPRTQDATLAFQARRGLPMTGVVDAATRALIDPTLFASPGPIALNGALPPISFVQARDYGWGNRTAIDIIVLHSAEIGEFHSSAEALGHAFRLGMPKPASCHYGVDDDSIQQYVKDKDIAFHAPGVNTRSLGIEQAGYAKQTRDEWLDPYGQRMLRLVAKLVAAKCRQYSVPLVWLKPEEIVAGARGICEHIDVTHAYPGKGSGHWDCGPNYPMGLVLEWAQEEQRR